MKHIPKLLVYSRLLAAAVLLVISLTDIDPSLKTRSYNLLILWAVISDIFDGIIARKLNVSNEKLRVLDSNIDQVFWLTTISVIGLAHIQFFQTHILPITILIVLELATYLFCWLRFKKTVSTHCISSKIWVLSLLVFLIDLNTNGDSYWGFGACLILGYISRLEILIIIISLKEWITDVPSVFSLKKIKRGESIKRHKLFNG